ncbi:MAG: hypothetical protein MI802_10020, partial [Desulfobacterales bacterium]|nr:hypothetical protein [Desulfobacterales bacterium]
RSKIKRSDEIGKLANSLDLMAARLGHHETQEQVMISNLADRSQQLKQMNEYLVYFEESERQVISSKLHGTIAQTLGISASRVRQLLNKCDGNHKRDIEDILSVIDHAIREIRSIIYELAPPMLKDFDIDVAIDFLVEEFNEKYNVRFSFDNNVGGAVPLNRALKLTFYRAVKTILTGILEHSDRPFVNIKMSAEETVLFIQITADGIGLKKEHILDLPASNSGHTLQERMERLGGEMTVNQNSEYEFYISLYAPVLPENHPD